MDLGSNHCRHCDHEMADHSADGTECEWCPEGYCEFRAKALEPHPFGSGSSGSLSASASREPWEDAWHGRVAAYLSVRWQEQRYVG